MAIRTAVEADGLARITLARPAQYNALDLDAMVQLQEAARSVAGDESVRVVIVQGEGPAFSAGGDIGFMRDRRDDASTMLQEVGRALNPAITLLRESDAIVIVSVHGSVAGGSVGLMLAGDFVVAAAGTRINLAYSRMGGSPDAGCSWFLPRIVGHQKAMELLTLSDTFDAEEARQMGLVNYVVDPGEREAFTERLARRLLAAPCVTLSNVKRLVRRAQHTELAPHLELEIEAYARACATPDFREGVAAFLDKRKPVFGRKT